LYDTLTIGKRCSGPTNSVPLVGECFYAKTPELTVVSQTARPPANSRWKWLGPTKNIESASYESTPRDYPVDGLYGSDDGTLVRAASFDMTFREMVDGALKTYPREQQVRHNRSVTLEDLVTEVPVSYLRFYDEYDHNQGHPKP